MDSLAKINQIIDLYSNRDMNEAETRFKIIDIILKEVLCWPDLAFTLESKSSSGYADYILKRPNGIPVLVIEAKKEGVYFSLPLSPNSNNLFRKIKIKELLTDANINKAVLQVKGYCEDIGSDYACVCNGHEWIFFHINPQEKPWKELPAYVITRLDYFRDLFILAKEMFSYEAVIKNYSLRKFIGTNTFKSGEIFYPKNSIISYDTPVVNNDYANVFNSLSLRFLTNIPADDSEFMDACYVTHRHYHDILQKNIDNFIYDSLTPYFKVQGFKDFFDDKRGGSFGEKVSELMDKQNRNAVMILFGGKGSGKSTFIRRYLYHIQPNPIKHFSIISLIDLINCSQKPDELTDEIWIKLRDSLDKDSILKDTKDDLLKLFADQYQILEKQFLSGLNKNSVEYLRIVNDFLLKCKADIKYCTQRLALTYKNQRKGLIVVLDNMDQLPVHLQDICFLTAKEISSKLTCLVIISMREERYFNAKNRGVLDAYHNQGFHLSAPIITQVLQKRIAYILKQLKENKSLVDECEINDTKKETITKFLTICLHNLKYEESSLNQFLSNTTHNDVRQALGYISRFLTSGYTDVSEMSSHSSWKFVRHQVIKPMMIPDRFFYDERYSDIPNMYQIRDVDNGSHFTSFRILKYLYVKSFEKILSGFIDAKFLVQEFETRYNLRRDCELNLNIMLQKGLIESSNRLEEYSPDIDQIRITSFGKYMYSALSKDFSYIDLACLDCGIFDEKLFHKFYNSANNEIKYFHEKNFYDRILLRLDRAESFIEYLINEEEREIKEYSIISTEKRYAKEIHKLFHLQKAKVLLSANRRLKRQNND